MADVPNPTPNAEPSPPPESKPAAPPAPPSPPAQRQAGIPDELPRHMRLDIGDGEEVELGAMVEHYRRTKAVDAKALEVAQLIQRADQKDPQAILSLFGVQPDGTTPPAAAKPTDGPGVPGEEVAQLREKVRALEAFTNEISTVRDQVQVRNAIAANADKLPMLARDPRAGADEVSRQLVSIDSIMRTQNPGYDPGRLNRQEQAQRWQIAFQRAENMLLDIVQRYNPGFLPTATTASPPAATPTADDQKPQGASTPDANVIPARIQVVNGQITDTVGNRIRQSATGELRVLPTDMPDPGAASAGAIPPGGPPRPAGTTLRDQKLAHIRARRQELQSQ